MFDANDLIRAIKKAATEAVEASQPMDFCFGKVTNTSPLKVTVEQKMSLGSAQLLLTETVSKNLEIGDEVILLKKKGGQKYLILDRVVN